MTILEAGYLKPSGSLLGRSFGVVALAALAVFFVRLYQARTQFRAAMKKHDIPIMPHSFLFGHLIELSKCLAAYPEDFSKLAIPYAIFKSHPKLCAEGYFYVDAWPFASSMLQVFDPDLMAQFTQDRSHPKAHSLVSELWPLTGNRDLVTMEGQEWKTWRSIFNPGFSAKNLTALLPDFLEEIQVLKDRFIGAAKSGEVIKMEKTVQLATVDVICRAAFGIRLHSQTRGSSFVATLSNTISWLTFDTSISARLKEFSRPLIIWNNNRKMRKFLAPLIEDSIAKFDSGETLGAKTISFLAAKAYRTEVQQQTANGAATEKAQMIDPEFVATAIAQLKIFIFAGHDTTASTLSFAYSRLYRDSGALAKMRAELDQVLGPDPSQTLARLRENPNLLNQMPYASAIVKETLRLYPPAASVRNGLPGVYLTQPGTGKQLPTEGFVLVTASWLSQRHPETWVRANDFVPERWLARDEGDPLYPRRAKNAFRPFELGPRNCIGQELAQMELRAALAMTVRELDFEPAYAPDAPEVLGERAYQSMGVGEITGHIKGGFPVRVKLRSSNDKEPASPVR